MEDSSRTYTATSNEYGLVGFQLFILSYNHLDLKL